MFMELPLALGRDWSCFAPTSREYGNVHQDTTILVPAPQTTHVLHMGP